jgi:hypothetical protein
MSWYSDRREYTIDILRADRFIGLSANPDKLQDVTQLRIPAAKIQPKHLNSVTLMLATAARVGKPRQ